MKGCSLNRFLGEIDPWLDKKYIHKATTDGKGSFILYFLDGTRHAHTINDCNNKQLETVLKYLKSMDIPTEQ